jgi:hypothetical protein
MSGVFPINVIRFILLLLAQVMFFSNIHAHPLLDVYIYPIFILSLPFNTPRWLLMILSLIMGLSVDFFLGSLGMHGAAALLLGFLRPNLVSIITPKGADFEINPNIYVQGFMWFATYYSVAYLILLGSYFCIESWGFYNLFWLIVKILLSTTTSILLSVFVLYLFTTDKRRRHT